MLSIRNMLGLYSLFPSNICRIKQHYSFYCIQPLYLFLSYQNFAWGLGLTIAVSKMRHNATHYSYPMTNFANFTNRYANFNQWILIE